VNKRVTCQETDQGMKETTGVCMVTNARSGPRRKREHDRVAQKANACFAQAAQAHLCGADEPPPVWFAMIALRYKGVW
jgi:hypothetical protein